MTIRKHNPKKSTKQDAIFGTMAHNAKFPHRDRETESELGISLIAAGSEELSVSECKLFCGFRLVGMVMMPCFNTPDKEGFAQPVVYFSREAVHAAMTELLLWYSTDGIRHGVPLPADLNIITSI